MIFTRVLTRCFLDFRLLSQIVGACRHAITFGNAVVVVGSDLFRWTLELNWGAVERLHAYYNAYGLCNEFVEVRIEDDVRANGS